MFFFLPTCVLRQGSSLVVARLAFLFLATNFVLYFNILVQTKRFWNSVLTNNLIVIRHAWHFYYALVLVVKVVCGSIGIACLTP
ncbi:DUF3265 domain-containing protein [Vibrio parahaemolyticus]|nr:DUF3265 domain-containing protein [Vibrio parahaemolyticus]NMU54119.1 DUF3265 domain-containing protein [Vibrio parahaemolyticus]